MDSNVWSIIAEYLCKNDFLSMRLLSKQILCVSKTSNVWWEIKSTQYTKYKDSICNPQCIHQIAGKIIDICAPSIVVDAKTRLLTVKNLKILHHRELSTERRTLKVTACAGNVLSIIIYTNYTIIFATDFYHLETIIFNDCKIITNGYKMKAKRIILNNSTIHYNKVCLINI